jgi:hypothetical protein
MSATSVSSRVKLLTALAPPNGEMTQTRGWISHVVVPAAITACLETTVTASDGKAIVDMIKDYSDFDVF